MSAGRWLSDLGPTNPIILRIVSNGSRRARHLWIRSGFLAALILALLFGIIGSFASLRDVAQRGAKAFTALSFVQITLICVLTPLFMAGAIAQESNPRTWEILLTTPLNRVQIVVGNLFGRLFFVLALLVAALPLMLSTQFFGGVPPAAVWGSFGVSACTALLVGAIAVTLSVTRSAGKRSVFVFYSAVVLYLFITWAGDRAFRAPVATGGVAETTTFFTALNPFLALECLLLPSSYQPPAAYEGTALGALWMLHPVRTYAVLCSVVTFALLSTSTLTVRSLGMRTISTPWWRKLFKSERNGARSAMTVWHNPIAWRESQLRGTTLAALVGRWGFVLLGLALGVMVLVAHHAGWYGTPGLRLALGTVIGAETVIIVLTALNMSATAVSREREDGSLDIILTTPIQPGPYLSGKLRGLIQFLAPMLLVPTITLGMAAVYVLANGFGVTGGVNAQVTVPDVSTPLTVPVLLPEGALAYPLVMLGFTAFAVMVGLNWSIKSKGTIGSAIGAVAATGAVAVLLGLCAVASGKAISVAGAFMNGLTPFTLVMSLISPETTIPASLATSISVARTSLMIGSVAAAVGCAGVVWAMHSATKKTFMFNVRKLAGTN
jgi:ABC-type transport system involved in multi-copper enzyme maturation permease subunit